MKPHIIIRIILTLGILVIVWLNAHWSVALALTMISFAIEGTNALIAKLHRAIKAVDQQHKNFLKEMNDQAEEMQRKMNVCRECEYHPTGIRPGSIHNRNAPNCLMHNKK